LSYGRETRIKSAPAAPAKLEGVTSFFGRQFPRDLHYEFEMESTRRGKSTTKTLIEIIRVSDKVGGYGPAKPRGKGKLPFAEP
jgi:hypothetical protein